MNTVKTIIGRPFVDGEGRWTVHVSRSPIEPETRTRSGVIKTRHGYSYFRAASPTEVTRRKAEIAESAARAEQFAAERAAIAGRAS